jgi:hypothetical protein
MVAVWCVAFAAVAGRAGESRNRKAMNCPRLPVEPCATRRGRYSTQNGTTQTIWLIGTNRLLNVNNEQDNFLPPSVVKYTDMTSDNHSYIFGDFEICPIEPDNPGHMRSVCVADAKNLVVQNLMNLWPPFRVRETWHR